MDEDLESLTHEQLIVEVKRLRAGIREHRDGTGHDLCWHQPKLWRLLPETSDPQPTVPAWPQFLRGCVRYRQSLDEQLPTATRSLLSGKSASQGQTTIYVCQHGTCGAPLVGDRQIEDGLAQL